MILVDYIERTDFREICTERSLLKAQVNDKIKYTQN
jgi:hypothetical protein